MNDSEETEEIKTFPLYPYLQQGPQALLNCKPISVGCPVTQDILHLCLTKPPPNIAQNKQELLIYIFIYFFFFKESKLCAIQPEFINIILNILFH